MNTYIPSSTTWSTVRCMFPYRNILYPDLGIVLVCLAITYFFQELTGWHSSSFSFSVPSDGAAGGQISS